MSQPERRIEFEDGSYATHYCSDHEIDAGQAALRVFLADGTKTPGELEDGLCGEQNMLAISLGMKEILEAWHASIFYPALAVMIGSGEVVFAKDQDDVVWYSLASKS